jgi:hypothetical protein
MLAESGGCARSIGPPAVGADAVDQGLGLVGVAAVVDDHAGARADL